MIRLRFDPETRYEVCEAACFFESRKEGLGQRFRLELKRVLLLIREDPVRFPLFRAEARRGRLRGFDYAVVYRVNGETIDVLAVMNLHRDPDYWLSRL